MKQILLFSISTFLFFNSHAQVTQINANKSLQGVIQLNNTLAIFNSGVDSSIWVSDGTEIGTIQISDTIKYIGGGGLLNGKYIFKGYSPNCGIEIFITDGTKDGTTIIKDINPGTPNSQPRTTVMEAINGYVYFAAVTPTDGCELWRTDGTAANTTRVSDIGSNAVSGIDSTHFSLSQIGTTVIFTGTTLAAGNELWKTDGTLANTALLKDIDNGAPSSTPRIFYPFNNMLLFTVSNGATGEVWRTDGTPGGTVVIKDNIAPPPFPFTLSSLNIFFHIFNTRAYFLINDGVHAGDALYSTDGVDGTSPHTIFLKDLGSSSMIGSVLLVNAFNLSNKFIFPYSDGTSIFDLYECNGTGAGTVVFKSFPANSNFNIPTIYSNVNFNKLNQTITYPLYNGKFYFSADDGTNGNELWMSDGTTTNILGNINPSGDGISDNISWLFTSAGLFFAANDGTHGNELWKTNGTWGAGTAIVQDIFPNSHNADPSLQFINNNKIFFTATDSDPADSSVTDLYVVDGIFSPLPVNLLDFTVTPKDADALLQWSTAQELNSHNFIIQSSDDAQHWNKIGTVAAAGNSSLQNNYSFTDAGVMNSGKNIVYYRLIETDLDGQTTNSNIIYLKIKGNNQWNVQLYSNPVHDNNIRVMLTGVEGTANLSINDLSGRMIYRRQIQNQNGLIHIATNVPKGVYILHVITSQGSKSIKFVKE